MKTAVVFVFVQHKCPCQQCNQFWWQKYLCTSIPLNLYLSVVHAEVLFMT